MASLTLDTTRVIHRAMTRQIGGCSSRAIVWSRRDSGPHCGSRASRENVVSQPLYTADATTCSSSALLNVVESAGKRWAVCKAVLMLLKHSVWSEPPVNRISVSSRTRPSGSLFQKHGEPRRRQYEHTGLVSQHFFRLLRHMVQPVVVLSRGLDMLMLSEPQGTDTCL